MLPALRNLLSEGLFLRIGVLGTTEAVYRTLKSSPEVIKLIAALDEGSVLDSQVREFVNELLRKFKTGVIFEYDYVLAAVAVALENHFTAFAEEFLTDLANLKAAELVLATNVAKLCLSARKQQSSTQEEIWDEGLYSDEPIFLGDYGRSEVIFERQDAETWEEVVNA